MPPQVPCDFSAASGMSNKDDPIQVQLLKQFGKVVCIGVHVIAGPGLIRASMAATIVRDYAKSMGAKEEHLRVPSIRRKRPSMAEHDGLPRAPILEIDPRAIVCVKKTHSHLSLLQAPRRRSRVVFGSLGASSVSDNPTNSETSQTGRRLHSIEGGETYPLLSSGPQGFLRFTMAFSYSKVGFSESAQGRGIVAEFQDLEKYAVLGLKMAVTSPSCLAGASDSVEFAFP